MKLSKDFKSKTEQAFFAVPTGLELGQVIIVRRDFSASDSREDPMHPLHELIVDNEECVVVRLSLGGKGGAWEISALDIGLYRKSAWENLSGFSSYEWDELDRNEAIEMSSRQEQDLPKISQGDFVTVRAFMREGCRRFYKALRARQAQLRSCRQKCQFNRKAGLSIGVKSNPACRFNATMSVLSMKKAKILGRKMSLKSKGQEIQDFLKYQQFLNALLTPGLPSSQRYVLTGGPTITICK